MSVDSYTKYFLKPLSVGLVAGATTMATDYSSVALVFGNQNVSFPLVAAGVGAICSLGSELINSYVFEHIPQISLLSHPLHTGLAVGTQVGMACVLENYISPGLVSDVGLVKIVGVAALSEVGGNYLANEWLKPWYEQMLGADSY